MNYENREKIMEYIKYTLGIDIDSGEMDMLYKFLIQNFEPTPSHKIT